MAVPALEVVALDAAPVRAVPDVHRHAHALVGLLRERARIAVDGRAVGGLEHGVWIPRAALRVLDEVERVHLRGDEGAVAALPEPEVPHAPVDHREPAALEMQHDLRRGVVGNVDPQCAVRREALDAAVEPVVGETLVRLARHAVLPSLVGNFPVEGRVREDQIDRPLLWEVREHVAAVAEIEPRVGILSREARLEPPRRRRVRRHLVAGQHDGKFEQAPGLVAHHRDPAFGRRVSARTVELGVLSLRHRSRSWRPRGAAQTHFVPKIRSPASPRPGTM